MTVATTPCSYPWEPGIIIDPPSPGDLVLVSSQTLPPQGT